MPTWAAACSRSCRSSSCATTPPRSPSGRSLLACVSIVAVLVGMRVNRPPERVPWYLILASAVSVAGGCAASILISELGKSSDGFTAPDVLPIAGAAAVAVGLSVFVRRSTAARDWGTIADAGLLTLGVAGLLWMVFVQPAVNDPSLDLAAKLGVAVSIATGTALLGIAIRLLLTTAVGGTERWLVAGAAVTQVLAGCAMPIAIVYDKPLAALLSLPALVTAQLAWGAVTLHPRMWWLTQPGDATEPWPTRRRLTLLLPAVLAVLVLVGFETIVAGEPVRGVPLLACILLAALLATRLAGLAMGYEHVAEREVALQSGAAALAVAKSRDEICRAGAQTAMELAGGRREAFVDVDLSPRPKLEVRDAAVVGSGEIAADLRGEIRLTGSLARIGAARTIIAPIVMRERLQGVVRVTGTRPLAWHLQQSLDMLAGKIALALEGLEITDDLAAQRGEARFRSLVQNSNDLIVVLEPDMVVRYVTPSALALLGDEPVDLVGTNFEERLHPDEREQALASLRPESSVGSSATQEFRLSRADGAWRTFEGGMSDLLEDPAVRGLVLTARDVSDRRALEDQLTRQAFHDSLTGLANRALLADRVGHALERAAPLRGRTWRSSSSTSTTSRRSTTAWATRRETRCSSSSRLACKSACEAVTPLPASEATSSASCSKRRPAWRGRLCLRSASSLRSALR